MPLTLGLRRLAPAVPSGPRFRLLPRPSGYRPEACATADCSGLAALASCGCQLPPVCGPPGSRSSPGLRPSESALSPAPSCVRLAPRAGWEPASWSCLGVPCADCRLAPACSSRVSRSRMDALASPHPSGAFRTVLKTGTFAPASRPALPDLPSGSRPPVPGSRPAPSARPSSLPLLPPSGFRPPVSAPAPPRARSAI